MITKEEMTAVVIEDEDPSEKSIKQEYEEFCKKNFSLKISGRELLMLVVASSEICGSGIYCLRSNDDFHYANKKLISRELYKRLQESLEGQLFFSEIIF